MIEVVLVECQSLGAAQHDYKNMCSVRSTDVAFFPRG